MIFRYTSIICFLFLNFCQTKKEKNLNINYCEDNLYVNSTFIEYDSMSIRNEESKKFDNILENKKNKNKLSEFFINKSLVDDNDRSISNDSQFETSYYSLGRITLNYKYEVLIYEKYTHRFPILFDKAFLIVFDKINCEITNKLIVYEDFDIGIVTCDEISFSIVKSNLIIFSKKCLSYNSLNEKDKGNKIKLIDEIYSFNFTTGKFDKIKTLEQEKLFDFREMKYVD